jgi:hypothetical protein
MSDEVVAGHDEDPGERTEHRWATIATFIMLILIAVAVFAGVH